MYWNGWPLSRVLLLFTGLALLMMAIQVTLFHTRQNFRHWAQWLPVIAAPLLGLLAIVISFYNMAILRQIFVVLSVITALASLGGFYLHFTGVGERVDGYRVENFLVGPPVVIPVMLSAISILGLLAIYWR